MANIYTPLLNTPQEIRLLNLKPHFDNPLAAIKSRLEPANLWHAGAYTCLSYRWGDTTEMKSIFVDDKEFLVRRNLYDALKRLRLHDEPRRLWIDAICINQDDTSERSAQVAVMQYIFQNATDVIAWIGEEEGGSHGRPVTQRAANFVRESVTPPGWVGSPWVDLLALVERPWFSRIWIVQEVAVAK
ncbi:heterokaryon incompatibility protein-domain-containing protein, partial [Immersiella caudata]